MKTLQNVNVQNVPSIINVWKTMMNTYTVQKEVRNVILTKQAVIVLIVPYG